MQICGQPVSRNYWVEDHFKKVLLNKKNISQRSILEDFGLTHLDHCASFIQQALQWQTIIGSREEVYIKFYCDLVIKTKNYINGKYIPLTYRQYFVNYKLSRANERENMVWTSIYKKCMLLPWPFTYNLLQGNSTLSLHIASFFWYLGTEGNFILKWISKLLPWPLTLKNVQGLCIPSLLPTFYGSYEIKNQIIQTKSIYGLNKDFIHMPVIWL